MSTLGERIKYAREQAGLSQAKLAQACDVSAAAIISNWESNTNRPDVEKLVKLCIALHVHPSYLLDYYTDEELTLSPEEKSFIRDLRELDPPRVQIIRDTLNGQLDIIRQLGEGYRVTSPHKITDPVFLSKEDADYKEIKIKCRELDKLRNERYVSYEDITKFLWSIGYGDRICLGYIRGIFPPFQTRVPNRQLYCRIRAFIEGRYSISIEGDE